MLQDVVIQMEEHAYSALADRLPEETSVEAELARMLEQLYEQMVPAQVRQKALELAEQEEREAADAERKRRRLVLIKVVKDGETCCRITKSYSTPLEAAHACENCIQEAGVVDCAGFAEKAYPNSFPITQEEFKNYCETRGWEVLAVYQFDLDTNRMKINLSGGSGTQKLDLILRAAGEAYRDPGCQMEKRIQIFADKIRGMEPLPEEEGSPEEDNTHMVQRM